MSRRIQSCQDRSGVSMSSFGKKTECGGREGGERVRDRGGGRMLCVLNLIFDSCQVSIAIQIVIEAGFTAQYPIESQAQNCDKLSTKTEDQDKSLIIEMTELSQSRPTYCFYYTVCTRNDIYHRIYSLLRGNSEPLPKSSPAAGQLQTCLTSGQVLI